MLQDVASLLQALRQEMFQVEELLGVVAARLAPRAAVAAARISETEGVDQFIVRTITVVTSDTPVQGPDIAVPAGFAVAVRQRRHVDSQPTGYVGPNQASVLDSSSRIEMADGEIIGLTVTKLSKIWFNADTDSTTFELISER